MKLRLLFLCSLSPIRFQKISPEDFPTPPRPLLLTGCNGKKIRANMRDCAPNSEKQKRLDLRDRQ